MHPSGSAFQSPHQAPRYPNTGSGSYAMLPSTIQPGHPFSQLGGAGHTFGRGPRPSLQDVGYHRQTFAEKSIPSTGGDGMTLSGGSMIVGVTGGALEGPGLFGIQQPPYAPGGQDNTGSSPNAPVTKGFPRKLFRMMQDPDAKPYIVWEDRGTTVFVPDHKKLVQSEILKKYFGHNNFGSLVRQLNIYAFKKIGRSSRATDSHLSYKYCHDSFLWGREDLLSEVKPKPKDREPIHRNVRHTEGRRPATLTGQLEDDAALDGLPRAETSFKPLVTSSLNHTGQLSHGISRMREGVAALEDKNSALEAENRKLKEENTTLQAEKRALMEENKALRERNTMLERCLGSATTHLNHLKRLLLRLTGSTALDDVQGFNPPAGNAFPVPGDQVHDVWPKSGVPVPMLFAGNVQQRAGGASQAYGSHTSITSIQPPFDPAHVTYPPLQSQPPDHLPFEGPSSFNTPYSRAPGPQGGRASGSSAPYAYWGNQPYIDTVSSTLPTEESQRAGSSHTRQSFTQSTPRTPPGSQMHIQGSPNRKPAGGPVVQVPRPHPGIGGTHYSAPTPGSFANGCSGRT